MEPIIDPDKVIARADELAEQCGCRRWYVHRGAAVWLLEKELQEERGK